MLYRFRSVESILEFDELGNQEIYFSTLETLNDPTEGLHEIFWKGAEIVWINLFKYFALHFIEETQNHLSVTDRENIIDNFLGSIETISVIKKLRNIIIKKHHLELILSTVSFVLEEHINNIAHHLSTSNLRNGRIIIDAFVKHINTNGLYKYIVNYDTEQIYSDSATFPPRSKRHPVETFIENLIFKYSKQFYVACFSKNFSNLSMWGNYADNHKGICLIFQNSKIPFAKRTLYYNKINYSNKVNRYNFFKLIVMQSYRTFKTWTTFKGKNSKYHISQYNEFKKRHSLLRQELIASLLTKEADWQFEKEYRLYIDNYGNKIGNTKYDKGIALKYDFKSLRGIIWGINTTPQIKHNVFYAISALCKMHNIQKFKFYQAVYSFKNNKLKIIELKHANKTLNDLLQMSHKD